MMEKDCEECLGELFSAQKRKIEEVQEKLRELDKIHKEEVDLLQETINQMIDFLKDLRNLPPRWCWATSYSSPIWQFLKDRGI